MSERAYTDADWKASHAVWLAACDADKRRKTIDTGDLRERYAEAIATAREEGRREERAAIMAWTFELDGYGDDCDSEDVRAWLDARDKEAETPNG